MTVVPPIALSFFQSQNCRRCGLPRLYAGCVWAVSTIACIFPSAIALAQNPLNQFPLGFEFADTLDEATARGEGERRVVLLVPSALRGGRNGNDIGPATEAFRAGPLVDNRIARLISRRFVAYGFDMDKRGSRYDEEAAQIAISICPDLQFPSVMPASPLLMVTPQGKELGQIDMFCTGDALLEALTKVVNENDAYRELRPDEQALDDIQRAEVYYDLRQFDHCIEQLEGLKTSQAYYLRGAIAREQGEWAEMKAAFKMVTDEDRKMDIQMQEVRRYWTIGNYEGIKALVGGLDRRFPHYQEALYYGGLALFHTDQREEALKTWEEGVLADPETAWALRLDWTRAMAKSGPDTPLLSRSGPESLLKRNYLSPQGNSDLNRN